MTNREEKGKIVKKPNQTEKQQYFETIKRQKYLKERDDRRELKWSREGS
jgi:hypothetical protein